MTETPPLTTIRRLPRDEAARETALREQFERFWLTSVGAPREIYDRFIAASPFAAHVATQPVNEDAVRGWWLRPEQAQPGSAILFLHGGGYVQGSATAYRGFVSQIASRAQVSALVIDYPLAPEATLPAAPDAALEAWWHLVERGFQRIAIVGDSAGGGLSLVTLARIAREALEPKPVAGVVFSPWTDLAFTGASMTDPAVVDPLIGHAYLQDCARKYLGSYAATDPLASPLHGDLTGLPSLLIQVGTDERLLDDSRQYAARAREAGVSVDLDVWEGMHHVFPLDVAHLESSRNALDRAADFLRRHFARA